MHQMRKQLNASTRGLAHPTDESDTFHSPIASWPARASYQGEETSHTHLIRFWFDLLRLLLIYALLCSPLYAPAAETEGTMLACELPALIRPCKADSMAGCKESPSDKRSAEDELELELDDGRDTATPEDGV